MVKRQLYTWVIGIQSGSLVSKSTISVSFKTPVLSNSASFAGLLKLIRDPEGLSYWDWLSVIELLGDVAWISSSRQFCETLCCSSTASKNSSSLSLSTVSTSHLGSFGEPGDSKLFIEENESDFTFIDAEDDEVLTGFDDCLWCSRFLCMQ